MIHRITSPQCRKSRHLSVAPLSHASPPPARARGAAAASLWALVPPLLLFPALLMRKKDLEMRARVRA